MYKLALKIKLLKIYFYFTYFGIIKLIPSIFVKIMLYKSWPSSFIYNQARFAIEVGAGSMLIKHLET